MRFEDYILGPSNIFQKDHCPSSCPFQANPLTPIVGIPLPSYPKKLLGVLVSRNPTTDYIGPYMHARARHDLIDDWRTTLMLSDAPPQWLIRQVAAYDSKYLGGVHAHEIHKLSKAMAENVYWTHLHKCCTDKKGMEAPPYSYLNAEQCAGEWLYRELADAAALKARFVLCLGTDVERIVSAWDAPEKKQVKVLCLPHPSGNAFGAWNPKDPVKRKKMADAIDGLFQIITA